MAKGSTNQQRGRITPPEQSIIEAAISSAIAGLDASLLEVEARRGVLRVSLENGGNLSMDEVTEASKLISEALDQVSGVPFLDVQFELEVSSAGIERPLLTAEHFSRFVGSLVDIRFRRGGETRNERVRLLGFGDETIAMAIEPASDPSGPARGRPKSAKPVSAPVVSVPLEEVLSARTVFEWPSGASGDVGMVSFDLEGDDPDDYAGRAISTTEENGGM